MQARNARFRTYFECLGSQVFATEMAGCLIPDLEKMKQVVNALDEKEVLAACSFHGDIGQAKKGLDAQAEKEQAKVLAEEQAIRDTLVKEGAAYREKYGIKFMVSAKGKSGSELLEILRSRSNNPRDVEWQAARDAIVEIAWKRLSEIPEFKPNLAYLQELAAKFDIKQAQVTVSLGDDAGSAQTLSVGCPNATKFEIASLSKSVGTAFALQFLNENKIALDASVNSVLEKVGSSFRLKSAEGSDASWADKVKVLDLMRHSALNWHYVKGVPANKPFPSTETYLPGIPDIGMSDAVLVINEPGKHFKYSGAGFVVLQHIIEVVTKKPIHEVTRPWLDQLGMQDFTFQPCDAEEKAGYATGRRDDGTSVDGGRYNFPAFAAGGYSTTAAMHRFCMQLGEAYHKQHGSGPITNEMAHEMLYDRDSRSLECLRFMGCKMGTGIFVLESGANKYMLHQGANDGFRVIFLHCYDGPDRGKGITSVCTADLKGVIFNAMVCQWILKLLGIQGVDFSKFRENFSSNGLVQEDVVNKGYRALLFEAFQPNRAEEITHRGPELPLSSLNAAIDGTVVYCTNDRFARAENLLCPLEPYFDPELFGRQGKVMDSWESIRHNPEPLDEMMFTLKAPSSVQYVWLSTKWHTGNHSPFIRLEGLVAEGEEQWKEFLPWTAIEGHSQKKIKLAAVDPTVFKAIKVQTKPDGGFTRLGLYADLPADAAADFTVDAPNNKFTDAVPMTKKPLVLPFTASPEEIARNIAAIPQDAEADVASAGYGAKVVHASDEHYGPASAAISPFPPLHMFDGLESARSRVIGSAERMDVALAWPSKIHRIEVDFTYFVNNNPLELKIEGVTSSGDLVEIIPRRLTKQYAGSYLWMPIEREELFTEVKVHCYPCGGFNRLHVFSNTKK